MLPMVAGDKCYMVSDRTHSVLLDALSKAFPRELSGERSRRLWSS